MIDKQIIRRIENEYPYPLALEFRRLNTKEYLVNDENRLRQILKISETTIHLLALISIVDLVENCSKSLIKVNDSFKKEFPVWFTRTSFGKWISLTRETIKLFNEQNVPMFIPQMNEFLTDKKGNESDIQKAFYTLTTVRNNLAHPKFTLTTKIIEDFCIETEKHLETILMNLEFLTEYSFLNVDQIQVRFRKWFDPSFSHTFSEVTGNSSEFNAYNKILKYPVNSPAIIIVKNSDEKNYLNLDPVVIYTNEGENKIADIFMYIDWDKYKSASYKPVWNGGPFNLSGTSLETETIGSLLKFFEFLAEQEIYKGYKDQVEKQKATI
jgi:hypothetical protein